MSRNRFILFFSKSVFIHALFGAFFVSGCASDLPQNRLLQQQQALIQELRLEVSRLHVEIGLKNNSQAVFKEAEQLFTQRFNDEIRNGSLLISAESRGLVFFLPSADLFEAGEAKLMRSALPLLKKITTALLYDFPENRIYIDSHSPEEGPGESYVNDWQMTAARSERIIRFFLQEGVGPGRLVASAFGEFHSIMLQGRRIDSRTEIIISPELL